MKAPVTHDARWGIYHDADGVVISYEEIEAALSVHDALVAALKEAHAEIHWHLLHHAGHCNPSTQTVQRQIESALAGVA